MEVRLLDGRLEARWFDVTSASTGDDPDGFDQSAPEEGGGEFDAVDDSMIPMTWARRALPEGIEFLPLDEHMERLESRAAKLNELAETHADDSVLVAKLKAARMELLVTHSSIASKLNMHN